MMELRARNPHNWLSRTNELGIEGEWRCNYCSAEGTDDELSKVDCAYEYPPCESCGLTPLCAPDCGSDAPMNFMLSQTPMVTCR